MTCLRCYDCRWVCEVHRELPWEGPHACGCGAAGERCPVCNKSQEGQPPEPPEGSKSISTIRDGGINPRAPYLPVPGRIWGPITGAW